MAEGFEGAGDSSGTVTVYAVAGTAVGLLAVLVLWVLRQQRGKQRAGGMRGSRVAADRPVVSFENPSYTLVALGMAGNTWATLEEEEEGGGCITAEDEGAGYLAVESIVRKGATGAGAASSGRAPRQDNPETARGAHQAVFVNPLFRSSPDKTKTQAPLPGARTTYTGRRW